MASNENVNAVPEQKNRCGSIRSGQLWGRGRELKVSGAGRERSRMAGVRKEGRPRPPGAWSCSSLTHARARTLPV